MNDYWMDYNRRRDREFNEDLENQVDHGLDKKGKVIVGGSQGGGAATHITGNALTDINITINLNVGEKVSPETLEQLSGILSQIADLKNNSPVPEVSSPAEEIHNKRRRGFFG